jgi:MATE family multidrug resistance protein
VPNSSDEAFVSGTDHSVLCTPRSEPHVPDSTEGGVRELATLSLPLVLSAGFLTIQLCLDRIFVTWNGNDGAAASMPAVMLFSTLYGLLQHTLMYTSVFVAQYIGAGRPERVGPVLWQAARLAVGGGVMFLGLIPLAGPLFALVGHPPEVAILEADYFRALCFAVPSALMVTVVNSFFSGRGQTWTVFAINLVGLAVNTPLAYAWILGEWGFPKLGTAGAGHATLCGSLASMVFGLALLSRRRYEAAFRIRSSWRFDPALTRRLLRFGFPNGVMHAVDLAAWTAFVFLVGVMSKEEGAATNVAFTINLVAFLPLVGLGQGVEILVGRRQGENRPELSAKTTISGLKLAVGYGLLISVPYAATPDLLTWPFAYRADPTQWGQLSALIRTLLLFVAVYTLGDAINVTVSYALRGAGDTRFVAALAVGLAWPMMVIPTWVAAKCGWGVIGAWVFATVYIFALAVAFLLRFRAGKWRTMRVIEQDVTKDG